jgi:hypothetical protein
MQRLNNRKTAKYAPARDKELSAVHWKKDRNSTAPTLQGRKQTAKDKRRKGKVDNTGVEYLLQQISPELVKEIKG